MSKREGGGRGERRRVAEVQRPGRLRRTGGGRGEDQEKKRSE